MILKLVNTLIEDLVKIFSDHGIPIKSEYCPSLSNFTRFRNQFYGKNIGASPVSITGDMFQNALLYNLETPKKPGRLGQQFLTAVHKPVSQSTDGKWKIEGWSASPDHNVGTLKKIKIETEEEATNPEMIGRSVSLLEVPINIVVTSQDIELIHEVLIIFYNTISKLTTLEHGIKFDPSSPDKINFDYPISWEQEPVIEYADITQSNNALNTLSIKATLTGPVFSGYFTKTKSIALVDLNVATINQGAQK